MLARFFAKYPSLKKEMLFFLIIAVLLYFIMPLPAFSDYDPVEEAQRLLKRAEEKKKEEDARVVELREKIKNLKETIEKITETYKYLDKQRTRFRGIQMWNALVGAMGATMDSIQKVNPGSSFILFTVDQIQDWAERKLQDSDKKNKIIARVKSMSDGVLKSSPACQKLQDYLKMNEQETAREMLANRQFFPNLPTDITEDQLAASDGVVTGKITLVLEAIPPAMRELYSLKIGFQEILNDLELELARSEKEAKLLAEEVRDRTRMLEAAGVMKEAYKRPPDPPPSSAAITAMDFGPAAAEMRAAWSDLKGGRISKNTFYERYNRATTGAEKKRSELEAAIWKECQREWKSGGKCDPAPRLNALKNAYEVVIKARQDIWDEGKKEKAVADAFLVKYMRWKASSVGKEKEMPNSGESLAESIWQPTRDFGYISGLLQSLSNVRMTTAFGGIDLESPVGPLPGARERYSAYRDKILSPIEKMKGILADVTALDKTAASLVDEADRLAAELNKKEQLWSTNIVCATAPGQYYCYDFTYITPYLKSYKALYEGVSKRARERTAEIMKANDELVQKLGNVVAALTGAQPVLDKASKIIDTHQKISQLKLYSPINLLIFLNNYGVSRDSLNQLERVIQNDLATPQKVDEYAQFVSGIINLPILKTTDKAYLENLRKTYNKERASLVSALDQYTQYWDEIRKMEDELDSMLKSLSNAIMAALEPISLDAAFKQSRHLERETLLLDMVREKKLGLTTFDHYYYQFNYDQLNNYDELLTQYEKLAEKFRSLLYPALAKYGPSKEDQEITKKIQEFYGQFKQAYESRNDSRVMSFLSDDWTSGDGTTLSDLQVNMNRTFKMFDEIRYNIQNIKIEKTSTGRYRVSYDVTITSRMYRKNIKHEEKSSVTEELAVDKSGKIRIARTLGGRFWYIH